jgi:hypothetical protein
MRQQRDAVHHLPVPELCGRTIHPPTSKHTWLGIQGRPSDDTSTPGGTAGCRCCPCYIHTLTLCTRARRSQRCIPSQVCFERSTRTTSMNWQRRSTTGTARDMALPVPLHSLAVPVALAVAAVCQCSPCAGLALAATHQLSRSACASGIPSRTCVTKWHQAILQLAKRAILRSPHPFPDGSHKRQRFEWTHRQLHWKTQQKDAPVEYR